jgi:inosine/xanthosine triphosphatase
MKIVLASTSAVKIEACKKAFSDFSDVNIVTAKVSSHVREQPLNEETLTGAFNRISAARRAVPDADLYISIESGLFEEKGTYVDRAIVIIAEKEGQKYTVRGEGVEFPGPSVEEARKRGFDQWTVGRVMQEQGIVRQHDDPHLDLSGKSRAEYINEAMRRAVAALDLKP